jgi:hypothetical protein
MAYFGKCLKYEKRDAIRTGNDNFRIKANHTNEELVLLAKEKQVEQYLAKVEQKAITHVCPENQLKARLANTLEPVRSYELLSKVKGLEIVGSTVRIHLRADCQLSEHEKDVFLSQVQSIYSTLEVDIESVEYVVENGYKPTNEKSELETKTTVLMSTLHQDIWGEVSRQLIETFGIHVYNNWFSRLKPVIDEQNKTIELKAPNLFIGQWIENTYGGVIQKIAKRLNMEIVL